ncbi:MAG: helix-turn-helix domain-containing protein [Ruminococcus sp.]
MSQNEIIAKRLSELRKEKGVKQDDIAEILNVKRATVANYETGKRAPDYESLIRLADYYGVSCDYIIRGVKSEFAEIHRLTGLSNEAITILRDLKLGNMSFYMNIINFLIEETKFTLYEDDCCSYKESILQKLYEYFLYSVPDKSEYIVSSGGDFLPMDRCDENDIELLADNHFTNDENEYEFHISKVNIKELLECYRFENLTEQIKNSKKKYLEKGGD